MISAGASGLSPAAAVTVSFGSSILSSSGFLVSTPGREPGATFLSVLLFYTDLPLQYRPLFQFSYNISKGFTGVGLRSRHIDGQICGLRIHHIYTGRNSILQHNLTEILIVIAKIRNCSINWNLSH